MALHLVTGGAGFIGSHLVRALVARGDRARVLDDLSSGKLDNLDGLEQGQPGSGAPVELQVGDLTDPACLAAACEGVEGAFHEAAFVSVPQSVAQPERCFAVNVSGTLGLLEAARQAGVRKLVFASSSAAYGESETLPKTEDMLPAPVSPYAASKVAGEHLLAVWARCFGLQTVALRYFNVFGPGQRDDSPYTGVIALLAAALLESRTPTIYGDGGQTRDFTYVQNVVEANLAALDRDLEPGVVINVGAGERVSVSDLWVALCKLAGRSIAPTYAPPRAGDVRHSLASIERARALLGYRPRIGWRAGLEPTLAWYRSRAAAARS
jgi:UDP-N-acetylglucosamine/UDP-N-acetyl-alpha-D-glucosaminouronate 4-epimerase